VSFSGTVTPPNVSGAPLVTGASRTDLLMPAGWPATQFPALAPSASYLSTAPLPAVKATHVVFQQVTTGAFVQPSIGMFAWVGDPALGQLVGLALTNNVLPMTISPNTAISSIDSTTFPQPSALLVIAPQSFIGTKIAGYALPRSTTLNPNGFTYSTFGGWSEIPNNAPSTDGFFSFGVPTLGVMLASGTASYAGQGDGTFVDAATGNPAEGSHHRHRAGEFRGADSYADHQRNHDPGVGRAERHGAGFRSAIEPERRAHLPRGEHVHRTARRQRQRDRTVLRHAARRGHRDEADGGAARDRRHVRSDPSRSRLAARFVRRELELRVPRPNLPAQRLEIASAYTSPMATPKEELTRLIERQPGRHSTPVQ